MAEKSEECRVTTDLVKITLKGLAFKIQEEKSQLSLAKVVQFLGFIMDSIQMKVYLPGDKVRKMSEVCDKLTNTREGTVQEVTSVVGLMNSYAEATDYGDNHKTT